MFGAPSYRIEFHQRDHHRNYADSGIIMDIIGKSR